VYTSLLWAFGDFGLVKLSENKIVQKNDSINRLLPPPLLSSIGLGWRGLVVEHYRVPPCELPDLPVAHHIVELASQQHVSLGERPNWRGHLKPYSKYPGHANFFADGVRPRLRSFTQTDLIICGLEPEFVMEVSGELESNSALQFQGGIDISDENLSHFMKLFENAAKAAETPNNLYLDHLIYAFTLHLFSLGQNRQTNHMPKEALALPRLRRVIERMRADLCTNLDLKTLAAESGYSRNHFLRMFRTATEVTPHQYLLRLRVEKAQLLMKTQSLRMIDVAESCGFTSQSQFSRVFKQVVGITPKQYRR
jgi:AraC family transcriptional regulator